MATQIIQPNFPELDRKDKSPANIAKARELLEQTGQQLFTWINMFFQGISEAV